MADSGSINTAELAGRVAEHASVGIRAVLERVDEGWLTLRTDVSLAGPEVQFRSWRYPEFVFLELAAPGAMVAALMNGKTIDIAGLTVIPRPAMPNGNYQRSPSRRRGRGGSTSIHPRTEWEIRPADIPSVQSTGLLVGDGPTFLRLDDARSSFFYATAPAVARDEGSLWVVTENDRRGRIDRVTIAPTSITVVVKGDHLDGVSVQLTTPNSTTTKPLSRRGQVRFRLPDGLTADSLLCVRDAKDWLDYRYFSATGSGAGDDSIVWEEPGVELDALIASGEGQHVEFKRQFPPLHQVKGQEAREADELKRHVLKSVAAFASGRGGTILFGVENDGTVIGIDDAERDAHEVRFVNAIRSTIEPQPPYAWRVIRRGTAAVVVLDVTGTGRPHAYTSGNRPEFYVRAGANTMPAKLEEIRGLFAADTASTSYPF